MQIIVSGKHLDVGSALHDYVESSLQDTVKKYFENAVSADVVFTKIRHLFKVDILVNEGTGTHLVIKSSAEDDDAYSSFDLAVARIAKQLRKYKGRIKDHQKTRVDKEMNAFGATKYVLSSELNEMSSGEETPVIIAEKPTEIETLTVSDAVMRMDLGQLPAVMFINKKTLAVNVVYRRQDGNISWIVSGNDTKIAA
jgi:ribosomal subunit interface protein